MDLQVQIDDLLEELSRKEAEWCSKEEKLMLEVSYTVPQWSIDFLFSFDFN